MAVSCLAIVALICIDQNADIDVVSNSIWRGARIRIGSVETVSIIRSDSPLAPDRRRMSRYCSEGSCVYYHCYCDSSIGNINCRISYNEQPDRFNRIIEIRSVNLINVENAIANTRVFIFRGKDPVSLGNLRDRSSQEGAPYCRLRRDRTCR